MVERVHHVLHEVVSRLALLDGIGGREQEALEVIRTRPARTANGPARWWPLRSSHGTICRPREAGPRRPLSGVR